MCRLEKFQNPQGRFVLSAQGCERIWGTRTQETHVAFPSEVRNATASKRGLLNGHAVHLPAMTGQVEPLVRMSFKSSAYNNFLVCPL